MLNFEVCFKSANFSSLPVTQSKFSFIRTSVLNYFSFMIRFKSIIKKFGEQGEKTGWTYIEIPEEVASKIKPGCKKSFRVKGTLDNYPIEKTSLLPMGGGSFIIPINAAIRKGLVT